MRPPTVGFDLDMTLLDSRPGIAAAYQALSAEYGVEIDTALVVSRLGPPLTHELANWFPPGKVESVAARYRELYPGIAVAAAPLLPGARESVEAVRAHGGKALVVTGKFAANAQLHLDHLRLTVDALYGDVWGAQKADALTEHHAEIYVGDHVGDMLAAREAGAVAVAVQTGGCTAGELRDAGAAVILRDLTEFPGWLGEYILDGRLAALDAALRELGSVLVAFSGGADSAFLLAAAVRALGPENVAAATAVSPSLPATELAAAAEFARGLGIRHLTPRTDEMSREGYRANAGDRCYFCKAELLDTVLPLAAAHGLARVATGTNADDAVAGFRPGIGAAAERGAATPLLAAGLTKSQVRAASRRWGLVTADKPAAACLSSRVAYGIAITPSRLARIERAEAGLRSALAEAGIGVANLRVRDLGDTARVEVDAAAVPLLAARPDVLAAVEGFAEVTVDPRGFRSGSMNDLLSRSVEQDRANG
ncbi:MAG: pyridinium-3,5-biscarboxylic acid mononucleotide sulfurtransferase [Cryptosporangiaceae bacterium]|nr:pyridinium-3,5-biscarboxylic acid mononucleotide sulfurtransferase [Cryptosporangiaceae bacterium]